MSRLPHIAIALMLQAGSVADACAQVRHLHRSPERKVGYFLGDLVRDEVDVAVDAGWALQAASLPEPGRPVYWLDLRRVDVETDAAARAVRYRLRLLYQTFYAPLEARALTLPGFELTFERGGETVAADVPPQPITMSPLREIVSPEGKLRRELTLQPDRSAPRLRLGPAALAVASTAAFAMVSALLLAWQRGVWPFGTRTQRPFERARRAVRTSGGAAYANALLILHRAFDAVAGYRVLADDQERFLAEHARYASAADDIRRFFAASRLIFFGEDEMRARQILPPAALGNLVRRLAAAERRPP